VIRGNLLERYKKSIFNPLHFNIISVEGYSLRTAKRIIAISRGTEKEITDCYELDRSRIVCLPNGVEIKTFNMQNKAEYRREVRDRCGIGADDFVLIFPAHEFRRKGLHGIIEALGSINSERLCLLVVGRDDPRPFRKQIEASRLKSKVVFTGEVADINRYYAASDAMVFPTAYEPFGLIILEAMALGLPVFVTRSAGAAELITDGRDGILLNDCKNAGEIRDAILSLLNAPDKGASIGREAQKTAERYSWDVIAEKTYRLYEEILREKRKGCSAGAENIR
jgi:UDP-glucose:(heptosyl)LPS alpha-1,3-glucosyltransferase